MTRLWIDCTRTLSSGLHTGIQRVVRRLLQQAHARHAAVAPVRWCTQTQAWLPVDLLPPHPQDLFTTPLRWSPPPLSRGDALLLPDALWHVAADAPLLAAQRQGLTLHGVCHDVLPASHPQWFPSALAQPFTRYWEVLLCAAQSIICVSAQTQRSLTAWAHQQQWPVPPIQVIHPGVDAPQKQHTPVDLPVLPDDQPIIVQVGTVEPRKGYACVADAFEQLWQQGYAYYWLVIGQSGWANDGLKQRLLNLHEGPAPMSWLQRATDAQLHALYDRATLFVGAAANEGYGLPVSEAACAGLPLVLNDTAIYRETHARTPWAAVHWVQTPSAWPRALITAASTQAARSVSQHSQPLHADLCWSQVAQAFIMAALLPTTSLRASP